MNLSMTVTFALDYVLVNPSVMSDQSNEIEQTVISIEFLLAAAIFFMIDTVKPCVTKLSTIVHRHDN